MGVSGKTYKLTYFDVRGRAEVSRIMFAISDLKFKDHRISYAEWPDMKPKTPYGQLPILHVSGGSLKTDTTMCQSNAIDRYVARETGLYGKNSMEAGRIDEIVECMRDAMQPIQAIFNEKDDNKKAEVLAKYAEEGLPHFLNYLTIQMSENWFLDQISYVDVSIYVAFDNIGMFLPDFLDSTPYWKLREWRERFESHPRVKKWLETRPVTNY